MRGVVGQDLTAELAVHIGRAAAAVLAQKKERPLVVIGKDTRISGDLLEAAVTAGLCSVGADVLSLGVISTPAVAYLTQLYGADAGVMLSASHNPYEFNGIKLFGPSGFKLTDAEEDLIEAIIFENAKSCDVKTGGAVGRVRRAGDAAGQYVRHLAGAYRGGYSGKILVDCANGSAAATAGALFSSVGVTADFICDAPDGCNINDGCGSTHIESLANQVTAGGYDLGLAFDGDADRLLAVDEKGHILDGDFLLAAFCGYLKAENKLEKNTVVVTTMTNLGFFRLMAQCGTNTQVTRVGDRYVLEAMRENGYSLGGEQSGHMIFLDWATTGDGQLSAVMLLNALSLAGCPLSELAGGMRRFPQVMKNVTATPSMKASLASHRVVCDEIARWEGVLQNCGRVVVRASGTEPYIRVMIEGEDAAQIETAADAIAAAISEHLI